MLIRHKLLRVIERAETRADWKLPLLLVATAEVAPIEPSDERVILGAETEPLMLPEAVKE